MTESKLLLDHKYKSIIAVREIITVWCDSHTKHTNATYKKNAVFKC